MLSARNQIWCISGSILSDLDLEVLAAERKKLRW
jgi:hypothetical protein